MAPPWRVSTIFPLSYKYVKYATYLRCDSGWAIPAALLTAREVTFLPTGPAVFGATADDIEAMISERIRRQEILYQPDKQVQLVLGEAALRHRFGPAQTLIGQLDRLTIIAGLTAVELSVLPFDTPLPVFPLCGFDLHDEETVFIETMSGEQRLDDPAEVALYVRFLDQLRDAAATGPDAVALIRRVMAELKVDSERREAPCTCND